MRGKKESGDLKGKREGFQLPKEKKNLP